MSHHPAPEPRCDASPAPVVSLVIRAKSRDIGGFSVRRALPSVSRRLVGPFIFFDHMGPAELPPERAMEVRPHPHIGLATVTYLFEGAIMHRDSVGSAQEVRPGDVNWMTAGRGIVHSERTPEALRDAVKRLHGIQLWVALPTEQEECDPSFVHHPNRTIPSVSLPGAALRVILGSAYGVTSPVEVHSPTFYVEARLEPGARLALPTEHEQRAAYVVDGDVTVGPEVIETASMAVFEPGVDAELHAGERGAHLMLLGGARLEGERYIEWNFVSSSKERLAKAKEDWRERRFPLVPGDEVEFIPLP